MEKKPHILLVDDEEAITSNLAAYLNRSGFETSIRTVVPRNFRVTVNPGQSAGTQG